MSFRTTTSTSVPAGWLHNLASWIRSGGGFFATTVSEDPELIFVSLGLAVIDEIRFGSERTVRDVLGGSGTYATLGARIFIKNGQARSIGWMVHAGADWPSSIQSSLLEWQIRLALKKHSDEVSTRGLLHYQDSTFGAKSFRYTTPVLAVSPDDLNSEGLLGAAFLHLLAKPDDLSVQVCKIEELRRKSEQERAFIIWEPAPPYCTPEYLDGCLEAARSVDLISPNHLEITSLFDEASPEFDKDVLETLALRFVQAGIGPTGTGAIIVRAGEYGCLVCSRGLEPTWLAPYYEMDTNETNKRRIIDTTGSGNAFLGGFAVGFHETTDTLEAAKYGTVAASFALEQIGLPTLTNNPDGSELWNGTNPRDRLRMYSSK